MSRIAVLFRDGLDEQPNRGVNQTNKHPLDFMTLKLKVRSKLWLYPGPGGWHFVTLPKRHAREIKISTLGKQYGWGSVRVSATIGTTTWKTSIFPDTKSSSYLLPVKADVRRQENLEDGDMVNLTLEVTV